LIPAPDSPETSRARVGFPATSSPTELDYHPTTVGPGPLHVDHLQEWFEAGVVDGFWIPPDVYEDGVDAFVDEVAAMRRGEADTNLAALREHTDDGGYDVVEATGALEVAQLCVPLARNGSSVLFYGVTRPARDPARRRRRGVVPRQPRRRLHHRAVSRRRRRHLVLLTRPEDQISIAPHELFRRQLTLRGSYAETTSFGAAIAALQAGRVATTGLISHRFSLGAYATALDTLEHDPSAHKIVLTV